MKTSDNFHLPETCEIVGCTEQATNAVVYNLNGNYDFMLQMCAEHARINAAEENLSKAILEYGYTAEIITAEVM